MIEEKYYSSSEVTRKLDISLRQLYYWELKGIVKPNLITLGSREFKRYSSEDFDILKKVKRYLDQGFTLTSAVQKVRENSK
jgi:DNA-binding transcriptional MerR regulator